MGTELTTPMKSLKRLYAANVTASSITNPTPRGQEPTGDGILSVDETNQALLYFFGARSADNQTATARVTLWSKTDNNLWVPTPLLALTLTYGLSTGIVAGDALNTDYFADTIAASTSFTSAVEIISPADDTVGCVKVDTFGGMLVQVQVAKGTCTSVNVLGRTF